MEKKTRKRRKGSIDNDRSAETTSHPTIENANSPKIALLEEYWNFNSFKLVPITKETILRLAQNAILWAQTNEKAYSVKGFWKEQGIDSKTWKRWCTKHPELQAAHDYMVMIIGCRREEGLIERRFEPQSTMFMMPHYDEDWKEMVQWRASLKAKEEDKQGGTQYIVIPTCERSPMVPDRKDE